MRKYLVAGLIILLPLVMTYLIFKFLANLITHSFEDFVQITLDRFDIFENGFLHLSHDQVIIILSKILIIIALFTLVVLIGIIGRWFLFRFFFHTVDHILHAIPIVNKVYLACRDFTHAIFSPKSGTFSQVVLVPFPSSDHLSIGLVIAEFKNELLVDREDDFVSVLVPGTPNPLHGFHLLYSKKQIIPIDMKVDEAIKFVMSCGSVGPPSFVNKK